MTTQLPPPSIFDSYDQDYCLWLEKKETSLSPTAFPADPPFTEAETLDFDYLPD